MLPSANLILLVVVVIFGHLKVCYSSGKLSIQLLRFKNDGHLLKDRSCCDNLISCYDPCDNYFKICVKEMSQNSDCNLGNLQTTVLGKDDMMFPRIGGDLGNGHKNPLVFNFEKWRGATLNIEVWDHESGSSLRGNDDFVGTINLQIIGDAKSHLETTAQQYKRVESASSAKRYIDMNIKVQCDTNYLVPDCVRKCVARDDDVLGHYTCDYANGRIVCNRYYHGDKCTKYCKPRDNAGGHYTCDKFGGKKCTPDWFGADCTAFCKASDDVTGHYTCDQKTGAKLCLVGWFGMQCLTYCSPTDDISGHYLCDLNTGAKVCLQNWFAANCTVYCVAHDDVMLGHYLCDRNGSKVCLPGWHGTWCTSRIISSSSNVNVFVASKFSTKLIVVSSSNEIPKQLYSTPFQYTSTAQQYTPDTTDIDSVIMKTNITQYTYKTTASKTSIEISGSIFMDRFSPTQSYPSPNVVTPSRSLFLSFTNRIIPRIPGSTIKNDTEATYRTERWLSNSLEHYEKQTMNRTEVEGTHAPATMRRGLQQTYSRYSDPIYYPHTVETLLTTPTVNNPTSFSVDNSSSLHTDKNWSPTVTQPFISPAIVYQNKSVSGNVQVTKGDTMSTSVDGTSFVNSNEPRASSTQTMTISVSASTSLVKNTAMFVLYVQSDNENITEFKSWLTHDLENKTKEHSKEKYEFGFDIQVINKCYGSFITIMKFHAYNNSITEYFRRNIKSKLMSIFNTTEVFEFDPDVRNQTDYGVCYPEKTKTIAKLHMRILLIMTGLFCFITLVMGVMAIVKVKKRKQLFTKVHPKGSPDQIRTKNNNFVSAIPKSVSNQELLRLEEL